MHDTLRVIDFGIMREINGHIAKALTPHEPKAFYAAWVRLARLCHSVRPRLGVGSRQRIISRYDQRDITARYVELCCEWGEAFSCAV